MTMDRQTDRPTDETPLISVIIPVYNAEEYLAQCLDDVTGNTYENLEILCVNDGSTDKSPDILRKYAAADERIRIIDKPNGGTASARNAGMDAASGEYIAFIDDDDRIHHRYFEILEYVASLNNADMVICECDKDNSDDIPVDINKLDVESLEFKDCFQQHDVRAPVWAHLYKRSLVERIRFDEGFSLAEDTSFNIMVLCSRDSLKAVYVHSALYHWIPRDSSQSQKFNMVEEGLKASDNYMRLIGNEAIIRENRDMVLLEAMKMFFDFRYTVSFRTKEEKKSYGKLISERKRMFMKALRAEKISHKDRVIYTTLLFFPKLYRQWRIHIDPTMLEWERMQKEKYSHSGR